METIQGTPPQTQPTGPGQSAGLSPSQAPPPTPQPGGQSAQGTQASQAFQLPERFQGKSAEEIARSYVELEQLQGRQAQQYGRYAQLDQQLAAHGGVEALVRGYNTLLSWYQGQGQPSQAPQAQAQQAPQGQAQDLDGYFRDWDLLPATQQAQKLYQLVTQSNQQYIQQYAQALARQFEQRRDEDHAALRREWDIWQRVWDRVRQNPTLQPEPLMRAMVNMAQGDVNGLIDLAAKSLTGEGEAQRQAQALFEAYKADYEQQQRNQALASVNGVPNVPSVFRRLEGLPQSVDQENALIAKTLIEQGIVGPGHF